MKKTTKTPAIKPLTSLDVPVTPAAEADTTAATEKVELIIPDKEDEKSHTVKDFNHAAAQEKAWKKIKDDLRPGLEKAALQRLFNHNVVNSDTPAKTVCIIDGTGAALNMSLKDTYSNSSHDPEEVTKGLVALGKTDPNKFVEEKIVIGFDTAVFFDENGNLHKDYYIAVMSALQGVAAEHGIASPFKSTKVVTTKPGFAELRWKEFTAAQQPAVSKLFPATISFTPIAPEKKPKA